MFVLWCLVVLCASAVTEQGRSKSPPLDEDGPRIINKAAECVFGNQVRELGSSWVPDLGVPIGVLYCMTCECVASQRKRRVVARVQCRSIKSDCPVLKCEDSVQMPGTCCKSCPGDNYSEMPRDIVPQGKLEEEEKAMKHYAALLTGRSSLQMKNDDLKPITYDNKNNVVATGRFTFQKRNLYFSFYVSDKAARPRSLQFVDQNANILEEIVLSSTGGVVNSHYQNATRKVCGVWKRLPKDYRRLLREEKLYAVLVWGIKDQAEFMLSGQINKYMALGTELFSSLLEPAPGTDPVLMAGAGGTAIVSTSSPVSPSIHIAVVFNGIFLPNETSNVSVNIVLTSEDKKQVILREKVRVKKVAHELNVIEIKSPVTANELRQLTRGRLVLSVISFSNPSILRLSGNVMTKATCEIFQSILSSSGVNNYGTSGLSWMFLNNEGSLVYNIQIDELRDQKPMMITLVDASTKRKTELEDLTPYFRGGWANGTVDKIAPKVLEPLYAGTLAVNVATQSDSILIRGRLVSKLVADARDSPAPMLLKREDNAQLPNSVVGMAWVAVEYDCTISYDVTVSGLQEKQLEVVMEFLPMIAPGAPVTVRMLGDATNNHIDGTSTDALSSEELRRIDSGVCFIKVKDKFNKNTLLSAAVKQIKVPPSCLPQYSDNDVPQVVDVPPNTGASCLHEGRFYNEEASWTSLQDACTMCYCQNGVAKCDTTTCPVLTCTNKIKKLDECCGVCVNVSKHPTEPLGVSSGCTFGGKFYSTGSKFHPFLIPDGFDFCTECSCDGTQVKCSRQNHNQCNKGKRRDPEEVNDEEQSREVMPAKPPMVFKPVKNQHQILTEGGCNNTVNVFAPYENGQIYHPHIHNLGEYKCVTCECKNGHITCKRDPCSLSKCAKVVNSFRNKTTTKAQVPALTDSCCSIKQCKKQLRRQHHRNHKS